MEHLLLYFWEIAESHLVFVMFWKMMDLKCLEYDSACSIRCLFGIYIYISVSEAIICDDKVSYEMVLFL